MVARAQVHLQTILNFFRDNDFLLETSTPKDITLDNIARLTNSTSTSTINSSKKSKRLTDIMEESPVAGLDDMDDESTPSGSSDGNSMHSSHNESTIILPTQPKNKLLLKPLSTPESSLISPPLTPRSPLPPSPLRQTPSPSQETNYEPSEYQRDSYSTETSPSARNSSSTINDFPETPPNVPETPPTPPEKTRLMKALEMRRQKLAGKPVLIIPKIETPTAPSKRTMDDMNGNNGINKSTPIIKQPSPGHKLRIMEAKKSALDEQRRHISSLEFSGRDLLSGWVNFQSSTSLVPPSLPTTNQKLWRRKYIRITSSRDLILSEGEEIPQHIPPGDKSTWRWRINSDVRSVEIPDRDEEQLPHSLRIAVERGGAVCCLACQTAGDLINLRRGTHPPLDGVDCSVGILFE